MNTNYITRLLNQFSIVKKNTSIGLLMTLLFISTGISVNAQVVTLITPGTNSINAPIGAKSVKVDLWGGGGSGGGATTNGNIGGGGGGGGYISFTSTITSGQAIPYTVGDGAIGNNNDGSDGGLTSVLGFDALGGKGGLRNNGAGGVGGTANGTPNIPGAAGLAGNATPNAGRGGNCNGPGGGTGGAALTVAGDGNNGAIIGGGGGGGRKGTGFFPPSRSGGDGARGQAILTYNIPTITGGPASACQGSSIIITGTNFTIGSTSITFNGVAGTITGNTGNAITVTVPATATSGNIRIDTPTGFVIFPNYPIDIPPTLTPIAGSNYVCTGNTTTLTSSPNGGVWSSSNNVLASINASTGVVTAGVGTGNVTFTYTVTTGSCVNAVTKVVTVSALPIVSAPAAICLGSVTQLTPSSGGSWISNNPAIASITSSGSVNALSPGTTTFTFTNSTTGCSATTSTVTVNPNASITANPLPSTVCSGSSATFSVTATGVGLSYQWFHGATQLNNGGNISGATSATLNINGVLLSDAGDYHVVVTGTCGSPVGSSNAILTVNERITILSQPATIQTLCEGQTASFTVSATGLGLAYQWYNNGVALVDGGQFSGVNSPTLTITNLTAANASPNYAVTITGTFPCASIASNMSLLVVNMLPAIATQPLSTQTVCAGNFANFSVSATGGNLIYAWYNGNLQLSNGGSISGADTATLTINPVALSDASNYHVMITNGCGTGVTSIDAQLLVNPTPFIQTQDTAICSGTAFNFVPVNGMPTSATIVPAGTLYTWSTPVVTGGLTGGSNQTIPQSSIFGTLDNPTISPQIAIYTVTPFTGGCPGVPFALRVTVNPAIFIPGNPPSQTACSGNNFSFTPANGGGNVVPVGTTYSWGLPDIFPAGSVSGATAGFGQTSVSQTLTNTSAVDGSAVYTVTAASGSCTESTFTVIFTVRPVPTVAGLPLTQTICSNNTIAPISISNPNAIPGSVSYQWERDHNGDIGGTIAANGQGNSISGTLVNNTNAPITVTFTFLATSEYLCPSNTQSVSVLVNPRPVAAATPATQIVCSGDNIATILLSNPNAVAGTTYTWIRTNTTNLTGIANSGSGNISGILTNITALPQTTVFTITPSVNSCPGTDITVSVTVNPKPTVAITTAQASVCSGTAITNLSITNPNTLSGTAFSWSWTSTSGLVTGPIGNNSSTVSGTWTNASAVAQTVTITATATLGTCSSTTTTSFIVYPSPIITATNTTQNVCTGTASQAITLSANFGTISWIRNTNANVTVTGAVSGNGNIPAMTFTNNSTTTQIVTFTVTGTPVSPNTCPNVLVISINVYAPLVAPVVTSSQTVCLGSAPLPFSISTAPTGGSGTYQYQWQFSTNNVIFNNIGGAVNPTYTPTQTGFYQLITKSAPCAPSVISNVLSIELGFDISSNNTDLNDGIAQANNIICSGDSFSPFIEIDHYSTSDIDFLLQATAPFISPASITAEGTTTSSGFFNIFRTTKQTFNLTGTNNTNSSVTTNVSITPMAFFSLFGFQSMCNLTPVTFNVTIRPKPSATLVSPNNVTVCSGSPGNIVLTGNITDAATSFSWVRTLSAGVTSTLANGTQVVAAGQQLILSPNLVNNSAAIGYADYTFTPTAAYSVGPTCPGGTTITVRIYVAPTVQVGVLGAAQNVCFGGDPNLITGTTPATGTGITYQWYSSFTGIAGSYNAIPFATSATYDPPASIAQTTWYIRETTSTTTSPAGTTATCNNFSAATIVNVNVINPGTVSGNQTICANTVPAPFTVTTSAFGTTPVTYLWQQNTVGCGSATWANASGTNNLAGYTPTVALTTTTYFRRITIPNNQTACQDTSICIVVTVNKVTPGTIQNSQTICPGTTPTAFTSTVNAVADGVVSYQWQMSTTGCGGTWTNISGATSESYASGALSVTTNFRRIAYSTLNGITCESIVSNCITVSINAFTAGTIAGNRYVCLGGTATALTFSLAPVGANISYQWQSSLNAVGPYNNINSATSSTYTPTAVTQNTYYQCVVSNTISGSTCSQITNFITVFVNAVTAPVIAGDQTVCGSEDPSAFTTITPATGTGTLSYQWQSSTISASGPWTNVATTATYDPPITTATTYYQLIATSTLVTAACPATSNVLTVTNNSRVWNGSQNANWTNALNWTPNIVPTSSSCVVIPNTIIKPLITGTNYVAYAYNLTVLAGGVLDVMPTNTILVTNYVNINPTGMLQIGDSASLVQTDNVNNVGTAIVKRITQPMYRFDYTYWNSPVAMGSYTLGNLSSNTQPDKYYSWNPTIGGSYGNWIQESAATIMNPTKGYIIRAPNSFSTNPTTTQTYTATFTGTPNNGDINIPIAIGTLGAGTTDDKMNLIGNPYPSAVSANAFLNHPSNVNLLEGTIYFWTHHAPPSTAFANPFYGTFILNYSPDGYASYNATGGTNTVPSGFGNPAPNGFIGAGQSFFVTGKGTGTAVFNNSMRVTGANDIFFRPVNHFVNAEPEKSRIWVNLADSQGSFSQALVGYIEGATDGIDRNYDGEVLPSNAVSLYSIQGDKKLGIQGLALPFEQSDLIPMGYSAAIANTFTIGIDQIDGLFPQQNIYLEDKYLNIIHDLKQTAYSFASAVGTFDDRFVLRFTTTTLGVNNPETMVGLTAFIKDKALFVQAGESIKSISIYDISGKFITKYLPKNSNSSFESEFVFAQGIYLAKTTLESGLVVTSKLMNGN